MNESLLYVEDEPFLARIVQDGLRQSGYAVTWVADGEQALTIFRTQPFSLCLLDIMLPTRTGYSLAEIIRAEAPAVPIIFLSAKALSEDVVRGFRSGGNDYLRKPFSMDELLVRIEAQLRPRALTPTGPVATSPTFHYFGACSLDTVQQQLQTPLGVQQVSYKETALLELLLQHRNQVLERKRALLAIWGADTYYNARSMDVFISHLRKLLRADPAVELLTIRGLGYKLLCRAA
jgi:DNA-binding response OmpR family regulator